MKQLESSEEIRVMLCKDNIELKRTGRGIRGRASRTGKISSMRMPSDIAGRDYKKNSKPISFNIEDMLTILRDTPTIKDLLMNRVVEERSHYEDVISNVLEGIDGIMSNVMEKVLGTIGNMVEVVNSQAGRIEQLEADLGRLRSNSSKLNQERARVLAFELEQISMGLNDEVCAAKLVEIVKPTASKKSKRPYNRNLAESGRSSRRDRTLGPITKVELYELAEGLESRGIEITSLNIRKYGTPIQAKLYGKSAYWKGLSDFLAHFQLWKMESSKNPSEAPRDDSSL